MRVVQLQGLLVGERQVLDRFVVLFLPFSVLYGSVVHGGVCLENVVVLLLELVFFSSPGVFVQPFQFF